MFVGSHWVLKAPNGWRCCRVTMSGVSSPRRGLWHSYCLPPSQLTLSKQHEVHYYKPVMNIYKYTYAWNRYIAQIVLQIVTLYSLTLVNWGSRSQRYIGNTQSTFSEPCWCSSLRSVTLSWSDSLEWTNPNLDLESDHLSWWSTGGGTEERFT